MRIVIKLTCDAASLVNAAKGYKQCTTVVAQFISCWEGSKPGNWTGLVKHMVHLPQSCVRAFVVRCWFGKDDAPNLQEHVVPAMHEASELEKGMKVDIPMDAAPWFYKRDAGTPSNAVRQGGIKRGKGSLHTRPLTEIPGTEKNKHRGHPREHLVRNVRLLPAFMFCFDGATMFALTGVSMRTANADMFTQATKQEMGAFCELRVLARGKSLTDLAEELSPGCSASTHRDHWLIAYLVSLNRWSCNSELQAITREPERQPTPAMAQELGKQAQGIFGDERQSDGRTDVRQPYRDAKIRRLLDAKTGFAKFKPSIDGDKKDAAQKKLSSECLMRVPCQPKLFERPLNDSVWAKRPDSAWQRWFGTETANPILSRFGLCIIHCAMRTMESCLRLMLTVMASRFVAGTDRETINKHLNKAIWDDLRIRRLIAVDKNGALLRVTLNGSEVRTLITDLCSADSRLLAAVRDTYSNLRKPPGEEEIHLDAWACVLRHWAVAMRAAYVLRATPGDRQTFRENIQLYVVEKAKIRAGACCWYDWQCFSVLTHVFDTFESLMAISQEGMEACQKRNNMLMRLGFNFANVGRIPRKKLREGREAVKAYLKERAMKMKSPAHWLWLRNLFSFFAHFNDVFERVERHKVEGRTLDWLTEFSPEWVSCVAISIIFGKLAAHHRGDHSPTTSDTISWHGYRVSVTNVRSKMLVTECAQYYAECECETWSSWDAMDERQQRIELSKERRLRWKKAKRTPLWRATEYKVGVC